MRRLIPFTLLLAIGSGLRSVRPDTSSPGSPIDMYDDPINIARQLRQLEVNRPKYTNYRLYDRNFELPPLDGTQWCKGPLASSIDSSKIAVLMIGEGFRSKNVCTNEKRSCLKTSLEPYKQIIQSHLDHVIKPLEANKFEVDMYLSDLGCDHGADFDNLLAFERLYGTERIRSSIRIDRNRGNMFTHIADLFSHVANTTKSLQWTYSYFVILRYDVMVDQPFFKGIIESSHRQAVSHFRFSHDYMHAFPGELSNCMFHIWDSCLRHCEVMSEECARRDECINFGKTRINGTREVSGGYVNIMYNIWRVMGTCGGPTELAGWANCSDTGVYNASGKCYGQTDALVHNGTSIWNNSESDPILVPHRYCWLGPGAERAKNDSIPCEFRPFNYHIR